MFLNYLILAFCISIDSFGIGITYGVRNTKIARMAKVILFIISTLITSLSIQVGNFFNEYLSPLFTKWIGSTFLILMGLWIIYQALNHKKEKEVVKTPSPNVYQFMIRFLGITIQIIRNPISSDLDKSKKSIGKKQFI